MGILDREVQYGCGQCVDCWKMDDRDRVNAEKITVTKKLERKENKYKYLMKKDYLGLAVELRHDPCKIGTIQT